MSATATKAAAYPTEMVRRAEEALAKAKADLGAMAEVLGYVLSSSYLTMPGQEAKGIRVLARDLDAFADALEERDAAWKVAAWNAGNR